MSSLQGAQLSLPQLNRCQTEVRSAIEVLLQLAETTDMELWSEEMRAGYYRILDELAALEALFHLDKVSLPPAAQPASNGDGLSPSL